MAQGHELELRINANEAACGTWPACRQCRCESATAARALCSAVRRFAALSGHALACCLINGSQSALAAAAAITSAAAASVSALVTVVAPVRWHARTPFDRWQWSCLCPLKSRLQHDDATMLRWGIAPKSKKAYVIAGLHFAFIERTRQQMKSDRSNRCGTTPQVAQCYWR